MSPVDRSDLLQRTDLQDLVMEICGAPVGRGRGARWHCPNPEHPDEHPSMGIYERGRGQRWKCHACGAGGTAIDLLMVVGSIGAGEAMEALAARAGIETTPSRRRPSPVPRAEQSSAPAQPRPTVQAATALVEHIEEFVVAAERLLWEQNGRMARRFLQERGFSEPLLRVNRVGFDPGPGLLPRPVGLPRRSPGVVLPVLDGDNGRAVYYQVRALSPRAAVERKYDQPVSEVAPNPKVARIRTFGDPASEMLAVTEGMPDGLAAAQAGIGAVAVLGVAHAGADSAEGLAQLILQRCPAPAYIVCFDPDRAGAAAGNRLADRLANQGAAVALMPPPGEYADLNDWLVADGPDLARQLIGASAVLGTCL